MMAKRREEAVQSEGQAPQAAGMEEGPRGRQGNAPACPYCSKPARSKTPDAEATEAVIVLCKSERSDPFFTRYYCPTPGCPYSEKVPRPQLAQRIKRQEAAEGDFSAR